MLSKSPTITDVTSITCSLCAIKHMGINYITNIPGTQPVAAGDDLTKLMQLEVKCGSSSGISIGKQAGLKNKNECGINVLFNHFLHHAIL